MQKWTILLIGLFGFGVAQAAPAAKADTDGYYLAVGAGATASKLGENQSVALAPSASDQFVTNGQTSWGGAVNLAGGKYFALNKRIVVGLGLSAYQTFLNQANGNVHELDLPDPSSNYQYNVNTTALFAETSIAIRTKWVEPYVKFGMGWAGNHLSDFSQTALPGVASPTFNYGDVMRNNFSYEMGVGLMVNVTAHLAIGVEYDYLNFGNVAFQTGQIANADVGALKVGALTEQLILARMVYRV